MITDKTYRLEPLDTSGVFLGLGVIQSILLGGGITLAVVAVSAGVPLALAAAPVVVGAALSFGRVGQRSAWEWLPLTATWLVRRVLSGERWLAELPLWPPDETQAPAMPPCLTGLSLHDVTWRDEGVLGCIRDAKRHTLTAVVPVSAPRFIVEQPAEQERLLAGWGDVLAQFAGDRSDVAHISWSDLTRPSGLRQHTEWMTAQHAGKSGHPEAADSYADLLDIARANATLHDVVVTITVARDRLRGRRDSSDSTESPLQHALGTAVDGLLRGLKSAGLSPDRPLDAHGLQRMLRARIDPTAESRRRSQGRLAERMGFVHHASAGPLALESSWSSVRVDGSRHRTFWAASWPRLAVPPCWLEPFLAVDVTRSMTVILVPVSLWQSRRRIERDLVKLESDAATREDQGRRVDARHQRATGTLLEREQELIAGFPEFAYVGLVTVTAATKEVLDDHSEIVEQLAREAGIDLRVLDGRQDVAWAAALPAGLAPRTLLAS